VGSGGEGCCAEEVEFGGGEGGAVWTWEDVVHGERGDG
jgi:hypothetical protein